MTAKHIILPILIGISVGEKEKKRLSHYYSLGLGGGSVALL